MKRLAILLATVIMLCVFLGSCDLSSLMPGGQQSEGTGENDGNGTNGGGDGGEGACRRVALSSAGGWRRRSAAHYRNRGVLRRGGHRLPCAQRAHGADGRNVFAGRLRLHLPLLRDARNAERRDGIARAP